MHLSLLHCNSPSSTVKENKDWKKNISLDVDIRKKYRWCIAVEE